MKVIDMVATGKNLKAVVKKSEYSVNELSNAIGISSLAMYKWFNGRNLPTLDNLVIMSGLLKIGLDELIVTHEVA